jgi:RNA polymerase sigma-70 factor (ECF subfamily)
MNARKGKPDSMNLATRVEVSRPQNGHASPSERSQLGASPESRSDEVLITLFQSGDETAFRKLVERYQEKIRNLVHTIVRDSGIVDDLAQDVFIKAFEALPRFRFESSFYTWVYRIAINRSRDELRRKKVRRFLSFHSVEEASGRSMDDHMSVQPENLEIKEIVTWGLDQLPEKYRMPVILKDMDGMSYDEIAAALECELGTVKSRISRGRAMLRKKLKPLLEDE